MKRNKKDENEMAFDVVSRTDKFSVSEAARALSKLGASKGGKARADKLSDKEKSEIGKMGAKARWAKNKK